MKTLSIKFKVAGVTEAQTALNSLRNGLNQTLSQNKKAVNESRKLTAGKFSRLRFSRQGLQNQLNTGLTRNQSSSKTNSRKPANNIVSLDTHSINELAEKIRIGESDSSELPDPLKQIRKKGLVGGSLANFGFTLRSIYKGFLESIGGGLGTDFGEGLKKALEEDLDFSFKRRGEVTGKTAAFGVSQGGRSFWDGLLNFRDAVVNSRLQKTNPSQARDDVDSVSKALVKLVTILPSKIATGYRRAAVQLEGLPRVEKLKKRPENQAGQYKNNTEQVVYTITGFAGQQGIGGYKIADTLRLFLTN